MIRQWSIVVSIVAGLLGGSVAAQDNAPEPKPREQEAAAAAKAPAGDVQNGKKLYMGVGCYQCHGTVAHGSPRTGPSLLTPLPFNAFLRQMRRPREMPPYEAKVLSDQQAADIYAYIATLPKPPDYKIIKLLQQ